MMASKVLFSFAFCLCEALFTSIFTLQQQYAVKFLNGEMESIFPNSFHHYLTPFLFRLISLQLPLQFLLVVVFLNYFGKSLFSILGAVLLSIVVWSFLLFLYLGVFQFQMAALMNLHWVFISSILAWLIFRRVL